MSRMELEQAFPTCEVLETALEPVMPGWTALLEGPRDEVGDELAKRLGLRAGSTASVVLSTVDRVALLLPVEENRRNQLRFRGLVLDLAAGPRLLFSGLEHLLPFDWPPDYRRVVSRLGPVAFGPGSELFIDDGTEADELMQALHGAGRERPVGLVPFYCDGNGARSCWVGGDPSVTWRYDPEQRRLEPESEGGFAGWFSHRLRVEVARLKAGTDAASTPDEEEDLEAEVEREMAADRARHPELEVDD